ncbi:MAG: hypothetical protein HYT89_00085 [Candidatus Omnitrophica bacterium]|nr:hypothetical protein [Candidatus Omnitrophota bacterium]
MDGSDAPFGGGGENRPVVRGAMMRRRLTIACFIAGLFFWAPASAAAAGHEIFYAEHDCVVYVPAAVVAGKRAPVLVCLPGRGVSARQDIVRWRKAAGFTDVFLVDFNVDYLAIGNDLGVRKLQSRIENLLKEMSQSYAVQTQRVSIAGSSAGAVTALALALRYPERYDSAGLVSTGPVNFETEDYRTNAAGKRFYIAHGKEDPTVPLDEAVKVKEFLEGGRAVVTFVSVPGGGHELPPGVYRSLARWLFPPRDFLQKLKSLF